MPGFSFFTFVYVNGSSLLVQFSGFYTEQHVQSESHVQRSVYTKYRIKLVAHGVTKCSKSWLDCGHKRFHSFSINLFLHGLIIIDYSREENVTGEMGYHSIKNINQLKFLFQILKLFFDHMFYLQSRIIFG